MHTVSLVPICKLQYLKINFNVSRSFKEIEALMVRFDALEYLEIGIEVQVSPNKDPQLYEQL